MAREGVKDVSRVNSQIKARLPQGINDLTKEEVECLVKRVEELEKENEWLKHELSLFREPG